MVGPIFLVTGHCLLSTLTYMAMPLFSPGEGPEVHWFLDPVWNTFRPMGKVLYFPRILWVSGFCKTNLVLSASLSWSDILSHTISSPGKTTALPSSWPQALLFYCQFSVLFSRRFFVYPLLGNHQVLWPHSCYVPSLLSRSGSFYLLIGWERQVISDQIRDYSESFLLSFGHLDLSPLFSAFCCDITGCLNKGAKIG